MLPKTRSLPEAPSALAKVDALLHRQLEQPRGSPLSIAVCGVRRLLQYTADSPTIGRICETIVEKRARAQCRDILAPSPSSAPAPPSASPCSAARVPSAVQPIRTIIATAAPF